MSGSDTDRTDRGVSPVLGVVLLVAITVLLSATIAGVVLGIGAEPELPPQVEWQFTYDHDARNLTIHHDGGDPIDPRAVQVTGSAIDEPFTLAKHVNRTWTVGTADTFTVDPTDEARDVTLVWRRDDGSGHVLAEFAIPRA